MLRMNRTTITGICMFLLGFGVGRVLLEDARLADKKPVIVDFCFLLRYPDLIGSRRFITQANIISIFPHGSVLESDSCPKLGASFTERLDRQDFVSKLRQMFHDDPYGSVPVLFEGSLYRPSLIRRVWFGAMRRFGLPGDQTAPVAIRLYKAVGADAEEQLTGQFLGPTAVTYKPSEDTLLHESGHATLPNQH